MSAKSAKVKANQE